VGTTTARRKRYGHPDFMIPWVIKRIRPLTKPPAFGESGRMETHSSFTRLLRRGLAAAFLLVSGLASAQNAGSVQISWAANSEPDIAGYTVCIGSSSGTYTEVRNVSTPSIVLSELAPFTTYYCVVRAYNIYGLSGQYSQELAFSATTAAEYYLNWTKIYGLSGNSALPASSPFQDGVSNLLKFAFNLDPTRPDTHTLAGGTGSSSGLPCYSVVRSGSSAWFQVEYIRRKGTDLQYTPMVSTDLRNYAPMSGTTTVTAIDDVLDRVVVRQAIDSAVTAKLFGRVAVTLP